MPKRLSAEEKHARKVARELAATLRQMTPKYRARQRELHRKQQARWAKANPECIAEAQRKWKEKNRDYFRQHDRDRYAADPEAKKARSRAYYAKHKKHILAKRRAARAKRREMLKPSQKIGPAIMRASRV